MKKTQAKKKSGSKKIHRHAVIELPTDNVGMEEYVSSHRAEINDKIIDNIEYALKMRLGNVEVFCFKDSSFVVVLNRTDFKESLREILEFSLANENFETCSRVNRVISKVDKLGYVATFKKNQPKHVKK